MKKYRIMYRDSFSMDVEGNLVFKGAGVYWLCTPQGQPILQFDLEEVNTVEELPPAAALRREEAVAVA
jgi:hypothetical protein